MARIKVTGYVDTEDFAAADVDESSKTGLSEAGYESLIESWKVGDLDDVDVEVEPEPA